MSKPSSPATPPGLPAGLATVLPGGRPARYRDRTAFVPNRPYPEVPPRHVSNLRFTLGQAARVSPAVGAVRACLTEVEKLPDLFVSSFQPDPDRPANAPEPLVLPAELADAFARLVIELERVLYLTGRGY